MGRCVVRFDSRLFSFRETKRGNPVLTVRANSKRIGLPVGKDGAYLRLQAHLLQGWRVTSIIMKRSTRFLAVLSKDIPDPPVRRNWLGVDINSSNIAVTIVGPGTGIMKQTYHGKDISSRQFVFEKRRASLQGHRDTTSRSKAGLELRRLNRRQRNYVRTNIWAIANQIIEQAKMFNANIAMENL